MLALVTKYKNEQDNITKTVFQLAITSNFDYESVMQMSHNERRILIDVLKEKADAENPNKQSQQML